MAPLNLSPWQGLAIPSALIGFIGYSSHYFIFTEDLSRNQQLWYEFCLTMIWVHYLIAIKKSPGTPPKNFVPPPTQWRRWCKKCQLYKPERSHHCKTCKTCVLKMDHHCEYFERSHSLDFLLTKMNEGPWTANCVGHSNMPHFIRFLLWVDYTTAYTMVHLVKRAASYWNDRNLPAYLVAKVPLTMTIILLPLSIFVLTTVGILTMRCFYHIISSGMSQIETWEYERLESQILSERSRMKIRKNYESFFGRELQDMAHWSSGNDALREPHPRTSEPYFTIDDIVFPYDLNPVSNLIQALGYPWIFILPWGSAPGDGLQYPRSEYASVSDQDLSSLPWPPDGGHQDKDFREDQVDIVQDNETVTRRNVDSRNLLHRTQWYNDFGEKLSDFGVDIEAETTSSSADPNTRT